MINKHHIALLIVMLASGLAACKGPTEPTTVAYPTTPPPTTAEDVSGPLPDTTLRSSTDIEKQDKATKPVEPTEYVYTSPETSAPTQPEQPVDTVSQSIEELSKTRRGRRLLRRLLADQQQGQAPEKQDKAQKTKTKVIVVENKGSNGSSASNRPQLPSYQAGKTVSSGDVTVSLDSSPNNVQRGPAPNVYGLNSFGLNSPVYDTSNQAAAPTGQTGQNGTQTYQTGAAPAQSPTIPGSPSVTRDVPGTRGNPGATGRN